MHRAAASLPEYETWGRERWAGSQPVPRHRHRAAYAALVLSGGYEEAGDGGRRRVEPGDVLLHDGFEAHLDRMGARGAETLNLPLPPEWTSAFRHGRLADADAVARAAERSSTQAAELLLAAVTPTPCGPGDWPDLLATALSADASVRLGDWARAHGLAAATVSRGFAAVYGVTPSTFRAQACARRAWRLLTAEAFPLAAVAQEAGFADQAHMTRAVAALTGATPSAWRRSNRFKTGAAAPA